MAENKKEQERSELHRTIWNIAYSFTHGGGVDGWDFKQYVLGAMFYRYISENLTGYINSNEWAMGDKSFNYANLSDELAERERAEIVETKGFFILPSQLFENVRKRAVQDFKDFLQTITTAQEECVSHEENSGRCC